MTNKKLTFFMRDQRLPPPGIADEFFWDADPDAVGSLEPNGPFDMRFSNVIEKSLDIKWIAWNGGIVYREENNASLTKACITYEAQISDAPEFGEGNIYSRVVATLQQISLGTGHFTYEIHSGMPSLVGNGRDTLFSIPKFEGLGAGLRGKGNLYLNVQARTIIQLGADEIDINFIADVWYV